MAETRTVPAHQPNPLIKLLVELGPLVTFFIANARGDDVLAALEGGSAGAFLAAAGLDRAIFVGTAAFMAATILALIANLWLERRLPVMPLVSGVFVLGFGALTLILQDELFIKLKPTIVNLLFAVILFGGMAYGRPLLKPLFGGVLDLTDHGWRALTVRWGAFFVVLAAINEVVWRSYSTDVWIDFKLFGIMPLTLVFSAAQVPLIRRETVEAATADTTEAGDA